MTDQNADFPMNYRVTFTVLVTDPELLLMKAREMEADMTAIENELTVVARRRKQQAPYEPEGIDSIEEALCWVLPGGDDHSECFEILNAEAVAIGEAT
jgi:hypothetical protein